MNERTMNPLHGHPHGHQPRSLLHAICQKLIFLILVPDRAVDPEVLEGL